MMGMLSQLMQMLQSLMGIKAAATSASFAHADGASEGDPHLSFNGNRWSSVASQPDLLSARTRFPAAFTSRRKRRRPNGKGVTWNRSATVALDGGATTITLNANGEPAITSNGQTLSIAPGETLQLGNGETSVGEFKRFVMHRRRRTAKADRLQTTLTARGNGVDVDVTAHDVDLGGALVNGMKTHSRTGFGEPQSLYN